MQIVRQNIIKPIQIFLTVKLLSQGWTNLIKKNQADSCVVYVEFLPLTINNLFLVGNRNMASTFCKTRTRI